jgi:lipoprotein LprG
LPWRWLVVPVALLLGLAGCGGPAPEQLPPAPELLAKSANAMAAVRTAAMNVQVDPKLNGTILVRAATGKLTSAGEATGSATLSQAGSPIQFDFVVTHGNLFLKGPTGKFQRVPLALAASIYDPTAVLSPDRGVAALLRTATQGNTEAKEDVNGVPAYRVRAHIDPDRVTAVVPGVRGASSGLFWLDQATSRLLKAQLDIPTAPNGPTAPVTVTLSDFDAPVTVTPPS